MIRIVPYLPQHLPLIGRDDDLATPDYAAGLFVPGLSFSGVNDDGMVVGAAGVLPLWAGVGEAWTWLGPSLSVRDMVTITAETEAFLAGVLPARFHRVQTVVRVGFDRGVRWATRLGFEAEGIMRGYGPDGQDYWRFARVVRHG